MLSTIQKTQAFVQLIEALRSGQAITGGLGLPRAARLPVLTALHAEMQVPILLVTDRSDRALTLIDELGFWAPMAQRILFPAPNPMFYEQAAWGTVTRRDRMTVLTALSAYHLPGLLKPQQPPLIVASVRALMARTLPRRDFLKVTRTIKPGQNQPIDPLLRSWADLGYQAMDIVLEPGQFSHRGGIVDIWTPAEPYPARLDFFGDEIDTLRRFDPATQRTIRPLESLIVTPAREVLPGKAAEKGILAQDAQEFLMPLIHPAPASLLDYLPRGALVVVDDLDVLQSHATEIEEQAVNLREESIREGSLPADFPIPYFGWSEMSEMLAGQHMLDVGFAAAPDEGSPLAQRFMAGPRFGGRLKSFIEYLQERQAAGDRQVVVSRQISRLKELWQEDRFNLKTPDFREGTLSDGWLLTSEDGSRFNLLTDSEIFGWERPQPRSRHQRTAEAPEAAYADLKPGDWVVHVDHGVGRYVGLVSRTLEGITREFLCVEYQGGDQLFVPIHQADRLTRYIGPDGSPPSPTRLGSAEWAQVKSKVRAAVEEVAHDLLELYARRQVAQGVSFPTDTVWQQELEASFPYVETEDQHRAIQEVKRDMESLRPMDRLLCGDVGYGKTEVALRAAFKAVTANKQVAILVPTTVLAAQHYETFSQRLAAYPVVVEMLSRFRSPKEQDEILKKLAIGGVDIIIGTHRLLSADVSFKDLGLVIIDEEQRFGVTHKEYLKKLRTEVDVLTLTATPIPRTLYMALTGVRDISTINTPPEERLPIITHIGPYSPRLVRQAVLREVERGGQVFFVHNRVQTINAMRSHLNKLVPEARVGIAHGQMPEGELALVMQQFNHGEIDILLCTSIIESGLDIPNANTLIVDRGDAFGLAQLYQLRGRVGRGAQRAYAYFFRHKRKPPTPEGLERLEVIAENTQLGAGYSIAMRDLEMRGAGELLGSRQSGYIASVGFHLYTRLLASAVRTMRETSGLEAPSAETGFAFKEARLPVSVDLPISIGIPVEYVPDQNMRLRLYRRLADVQSEVDVDALAEEYVDRFGPLPEPVDNLFYQMKVKIRTEEAGLASVSVENDQLVLRYPPLPDQAQTRNLPFLRPGIRIGKNSYWLPFAAHLEDWRERLLEALAAIND